MNHLLELIRAYFLAFLLGIFVSCVGIGIIGLFQMTCSAARWLAIEVRPPPPGYILQKYDDRHWMFVMYENGHYLTNWSGDGTWHGIKEEAWKIHNINHR